MSGIYVNEPKTQGQVVLHTTLGDIDIQLWSTECPLTCRSFVQLCLDGYYDGCTFHRVLPGFIAQTGDPTGTGEGGESIYQEGLPDEFHSRLQFRYRGLVGMAKRAEDRWYGSQFFLTLDRADALNRRNTLFGRVTRESVYTILAFNDIKTDSADSPVDMPHILEAEVIWNPFRDLQPRVDRPPSEAAAEPRDMRSALACQRRQLLSFEESDDDETDRRVKSAHELLIASTTPSQSVTEGIKEQPVQAAAAAVAEGCSMQALRQREEELMETLKTPDVLSAMGQKELRHRKNDEREDDLNQMRRKTRRLHVDREQMQVKDADLLSSQECRRRVLSHSGRDEARAEQGAQVLAQLTDFTARLRKAAAEGATVGEDGDWLAGGQLRFAPDSSTAYGMDGSRDTLTVIDPLAGDSVRLQEEVRRRRLENDSNKGSDGGSHRSLRRMVIAPIALKDAVGLGPVVDPVAEDDFSLVLGVRKVGEAV
ncbi:MAG: LOW QUALITY PROTEIN: hypothetical protein KVP17_004530 [Porospora cf. gigantea B]|uniref:uncharacterized protein n=1 Tax=Porospora cf. gigantea B TaxID=2853592 RepID=UPI0035719E94|nr:MAG: LOW QUALITY PROTEIN: hypothetical protein KVP17_004530 [Porospora cf. gigantea B]